jgi:hypothetical protein
VRGPAAARAKSVWTITKCAPGQAHRRITFAMLAHAYLAVVRQAAAGREDTAGRAGDLLPFTVPEVRRLLWHLVWIRPPDSNVAFSWSRWRRRHQHRAKQCHWRRRSKTPEPRLVGGLATGREEAMRRAYRVDDLAIVAMMTIASRYVAVLVLALYINMPAVQDLQSSVTALGRVPGAALLDQPNGDDRTQGQHG